MRPLRVIRSVSAFPIRYRFATGLFMAVTLATLGCRSRAKQDVYVQRLTGEIRLLEDQLYDADYRNRVLAEKLERERGKTIGQGPSATTQLSPPSHPLHPHDMGDPVIIEGGRIIPGPIEEGEVIPPPVIVPAESDPTTAPTPLSDPITDSRVPLATPPEDTDDMGSGLGDVDLGDMDLEEAIDPGQPVAPEELNLDGMASPGDASSATENVRDDADPFVDDGGPFEMPQQEGTAQDPSSTGDDRYEMPSFGSPPSEPEPPGKDDLTIPPIIEGEIIPPPPGDLDPEVPPGKVPGLPNTLRDLGKANSTAPQALQLHPGFSGAQQYYADDQADGLMLVVNVLDEDGRMMDLNDFEIDADLSIVALNPTKPGSEARIARWDFGPDEVRNLVRHVPVSGFHVPVIWDTVRPDVDEVIVHVRLQAGEDRMTCEGRVNVARNARVARWSPRAASSSAGNKSKPRPAPARPSRRM